MQRIIKAFFSSMAGLKFGLIREKAVQQEAVLFVIAAVVAPFITTDPWKLLAMLGSIALMLAIELLNTGIEKLADKVTLKHDPLIGVAKDCGSAAVFVAIVITAAVWLLAIAERFMG